MELYLHIVYWMDVRRNYQFLYFLGFIDDDILD